MSFIVYALGRSRSAWISEFLCYADWDCRHEQLVYMRSIDECRALLARPKTGTVETAACFGWRVIDHYLPGMTKVVIRRPVKEVVESMMAIDFRGAFAYDREQLTKSITYASRMLDEIAREPDVLALEYADLHDEDACAALFVHCLDLPFDRRWWQWLAPQNIQMDVPELVRYYHENRADVEGFKSVCKSELRRLVKAGAIKREKAGLHGVR